MNKSIKKLNQAFLQYESACGELSSKIKEVCNFNAVLTYCAGDGHLVLNEETSAVATLNCLNGRTIKNKLTAQEHVKYCI